MAVAVSARTAKGTLIVKTIVSTLFKTGLESLKSRFEEAMTDAVKLDSELFRRPTARLPSSIWTARALRSWSRFFQDPLQPGVAEIVIEQEQLTAQFVGDSVSARPP